MLVIGRELRSLVIEMVMSTDMSCHFQQIKTMRNALTQTLRSVLLKSSDSNMCVVMQNTQWGRGLGWGGHGQQINVMDRVQSPEHSLL